MNIDDVAAQLTRAIDASAERAKAADAKARKTYDRAVAAAAATHERAVNKAVTEFDSATRAAETARADQVAQAYAAFDEGARNVLSLPEQVTVKDSGSARMELWVGVESKPAAVASFLGSSGWSVDGPDGREFYGASQRVRARARLWTIATQLGVLAG